MNWHQFLHIPVSFNWLDVVITILLVLSVMRGLLEGFSRSVAALLGLFVAFWAAMNYFQAFAMRISTWIRDPFWPYVLAFILIFFLVYFLFVSVGILLRGTLRLVRLSWLDNLLGAAVGGLKGLVVVGVILFFLTIFLPPNSRILTGSYLYPRFVKFSQMLGPLVPEDIQGRFQLRRRRFDLQRNFSLPSAGKTKIIDIKDKRELTGKVVI